jgi:hypothetical protein
MGLESLAINPMTRLRKHLKQLLMKSRQRPVAELIASPRSICNPVSIECPVDETILAEGDHNGSTYYQHLKFVDVVRGKAEVEVSLNDGIWAVRMGQAAQESTTLGQAVTF